MVYSAAEIVKVVKRENNKKRGYLVINKLQGKHIPARPCEALRMFDLMADMVRKEYKEEKVLVIGFAETATAVGARMAVRMEAPYMQTTREDMGDVDYLYFSEEHSHAVEQKLVRTDLDSFIYQVDRILFVEDELTTGNTILNAVQAFRKQYRDISVKFAVASLLNGMLEEAIIRFKEAGVACHYLLKTDHSQYEELAAAYQAVEDCHYHPTEGEKVIYTEIAEMPDTRNIVSIQEYEDACQKLVQGVTGQAGKGEEILVLGTEEFMYPALLAAKALEDIGNEVFFHATTRSPILPCRALEYPIHSRYRLHSLYDANRKTFLYNLKKYASVFIVTDAGSPQNKEGLEDLIGALKAGGNEKIYVWEWRRA